MGERNLFVRQCFAKRGCCPRVLVSATPDLEGSTTTAAPALDSFASAYRKARQNTLPGGVLYGLHTAYPPWASSVEQNVISKRWECTNPSKQSSVAKATV